VSEADLEVIGLVNDMLARGDTTAIAATLHADVVWEHNVGTGSPEEGIYAGRADVVALLERILQPWEQLRLEPRETQDLGEGRYLIRGEMLAKHSASDIEVAAPYEQRLELRDGLLVKGQMTSGAVAAP
jgi:ketosteroid isomerase-like protein